MLLGIFIAVVFAVVVFAVYRMERGDIREGSRETDVDWEIFREAWNKLSEDEKAERIEAGPFGRSEDCE